MNFSLKTLQKSFENSTTFHGKFTRTKDEFRRISFALLLHNTVSLGFMGVISTESNQSATVHFLQVLSSRMVHRLVPKCDYFLCLLSET